VIAVAPLLVLAAAVATPSVGGHVTKGDPRNAVVIPEQRIDLKFDHSAHLGGDVGLECVDCHEAVKDSKRAGDFNVPAKELCLDCHDAVEVTQAWGADPGMAGNAVVIPPANIRFPHARHLEVEGVTCATCHAGVKDTKLATRDHLPSMEQCLACHDGAKAPNACTTCHVKAPGGVMRTAFASGVLKPDDHGTQWLTQHEVDAERDLAYCASCHAQEDCLSCHEGSIPPSFHDNNYLAIHPQEAMANSPVCASCHRLDRFCRDCHFRAQVTRGNPLQTGEGFHPPGWADFATVGPQHHARLAPKNLSQCTACHAQQDCLACHQFYVGAPRTHPRGWALSDKMRRLRRENFGLCLECHVLGDPADPINNP
jgi:predicted CXXCH cytochrome family protein